MKTNLNLKNCIECSETISYDKRHNKFCSRSCSASHNNKKRNPEIHRKQSSTLSKTLSIRISGNSSLYYCKACGKIHKSNKLKINCSCGLSTKFQAFNGLHKFFNLNLENLGTQKFIEDFNKCKLEVEELYSKNSLPSLAKLLNHPDKTGGNTGKGLKYLGIPISSRSSSQTKSLLQNRTKSREGCNRYKTGYFTYQNIEYYYRSSYELEFAQYLMEQNLSFDMENLKIEYFNSNQKRNRVAIPDFVIDNVIVEVKSNYTFDKTEMIDKFKQYQQLGYKTLLWLEKEFYELNDNCFSKADKISFDNFI
jgi:hypothetical protein